MQKFNNKEIVRTFFEKELENKNITELKIKKETKKKMINFMRSENVLIIHFRVILTKKIW